MNDLNWWSETYTIQKAFFFAFILKTYRINGLFLKLNNNNNNKKILF